MAPPATAPRGNPAASRPAQNTHNQSRPQPQQPAARPLNEAELLDRILDRHTAQVCKPVLALLGQQVDRIADLLPPKYKSYAKQLAQRALQTFVRNKGLQKCSPESFVRAVCEAAEYGLVIDGRLAYAVPYYNKDTRETEAQFQISYLGMIAVAKREGHIKDAKAAVIRETDTFEWEEGSNAFLRHTFRLGESRGKPIGVWCKLIFPDNTESFDVMEWEDVLKARQCSKQAGPGSIWEKWEGEMAKKTVLRRKLKHYSFDVKFDRLLGFDEAGDGAFDGGDYQPGAFVAGAPDDVERGRPGANAPAATPPPAAAKPPLEKDDYLSAIKNADNWSKLLQAFLGIMGEVGEGEVIDQGDLSDLCMAWMEAVCDAAHRAGPENGEKLLRKANGALEDEGKLKMSGDLYQTFLERFEQTQQNLTS